MATALSSPPARSGAPAATAPVVVTVASAPPVRIEPTTAPAAAVKPGGESVPEVAAIAIAMPAMPVTAEAVPVGPPPATGEIETFFAAFVDAYEKGRPDAMAALFDDDAETNARRGRAAIRGEYDELFRQSSWRRMQLARMNWRRVGDRALAKGEVSMRIGWRDGREVEQRVAMDVELVRRDGRAVIAKLSQQPRN